MSSTHEVHNTPADQSQSTTDEAKVQAAQVKDSAASAAQQVADVTKDQASVVGSEVRNQAKSLLSASREEMTTQAAAQQQRAAGGLRSLGAELQGMARGESTSGPATELTREAADRVSALATWLEQREPGDVISDVKQFARNRPGTFLAIAAAAGVLAGRLTRGLTDDSAPESGKTRSELTPERPTANPPAHLASTPPPVGTVGTVETIEEDQPYNLTLGGLADGGPGRSSSGSPS